MPSKNTSLLLACTGLLVATTGMAGWVKANNGSFPLYAFKVGKDSGGQALYLCRASYQGSTTPGKIRQGFNGCNISYGGHEVTVTRYDVYVKHDREGGEWRWTHGHIPKGAWNIGEDSNGNTLYLCRADYHGKQPGKTWSGLNGCDIPYSGKEVTVREFEIYSRGGRWHHGKWHHHHWHHPKPADPNAFPKMPGIPKMPPFPKGATFPNAQ